MVKMQSRHDGTKLAYELISSPSATFNVMFLGGFRSDMMGSKAEMLAHHAAELGYHFLRFDYRGHGQSQGNFAEYGIADWLDDALEMYKILPSLPTILIGSSMGGYLALLMARQHLDHLCGLIGIAAAPDFTELLMWPKLSPSQQQDIMNNGGVAIPTPYDDEPYWISQTLIEQGRNLLILDQPKQLGVPTHFIQGGCDEDVPPNWPEKIRSSILDTDVVITMICDGDHRLSRDSDLFILRQSLLHIRYKTGL